MEERQLKDEAERRARLSNTPAPKRSISRKLSPLRGGALQYLDFADMVAVYDPSLGTRREAFCDDSRYKEVCVCVPLSPNNGIDSELL